MGECECTVCGYLHEGEEPPAACPECGAPQIKFEYYSYEDDDEWDEELDDEEDSDDDWDEVINPDGRDGVDEQQ
jgi:predicted  nucleic acid-binding Zn-ribbon protein